MGETKFTVTARSGLGSSLTREETCDVVEAIVLGLNAAVDDDKEENCLDTASGYVMRSKSIVCVINGACNKMVQATSLSAKKASSVKYPPK